MKLRIRGNSIRLRLTKVEVEQLGSEGVVGESIHFGGSSTPLVYELRTSRAETIFAEFDGRRIGIAIPFDEADGWMNSDSVSLEASQAIGEDAFLRILVEKDFACLTERSTEDESDAFPNPLALAKC